jgi:hypothetical protein
MTSSESVAVAQRKLQVLMTEAYKLKVPMTVAKKLQLLITASESVAVA